MSAASDREREVRPARAGRRAAVLALVLAAACGGERRADTGAVDTATASAPAPVSPPDTVTAVGPDTSRQQAGAQDSTSAVPAPGSSVARRSTPDTAAQAAPAPAERTPRAEAAAPAKPAPAPAPAPAPKPAAPPRDTAAAAPAQATPTQQPAAPAAETAAAPQQQAAQPAQDAPMRDEYHQAPRDTVVQAVYDGWKQYNLNCARCHGEDVLGSTIAPHLIASLKPEGPINTKESFVQVVCAGRPEKGMPAWCPLGLEMEKIEQIYSYVKGRSDGEIGPGRPALRQEG